MGFNDDDFREYLYGNFPDDYRSYTKEDLTESVKTSIIRRHERTYGIWRSLASEPWIRALYGNHLPTELLSGQLNIIDFRERVVRMVCQPTIYANSEVVALRMQYPTTMPNMVYSVVPHQEMSRYANMLERAGYDEDNLKHALECKEKSLLLMGKMQAVGISEKSAKSIMAQAESVNVMEQFSTLNEKLSQAQTPEEFAKHSKQLDAFIEVNAEHLYKNREQLHQLNDKIKQQEKKKKIKKKIKQFKPQNKAIKSTPAPSITPEAENNLRPPFLEPLNQHNAEDAYGIKSAPKNFGIYDYMNNRMDAVVDEQLKSLDNQLSLQKSNSILSAKSASIQNQPAETSLLSSNKLSNNISIQKDISSWSNDYIAARSEEDEQWLDGMSKGLDMVDSAAATSHDLNSFKAKLKMNVTQYYANTRANLEHKNQNLVQSTQNSATNTLSELRSSLAKHLAR